MTNEDIIRTLEEFVKWGPGDKEIVIRSLSSRAIDNLVDSLHLNSYYRDRRNWEEQEHQERYNWQ